MLEDAHIARSYASWQLRDGSGRCDSNCGEDERDDDAKDLHYCSLKAGDLALRTAEELVMKCCLKCWGLRSSTSAFMQFQRHRDISVFRASTRFSE